MVCTQTQWFQATTRNFELHSSTAMVQTTPIRLMICWTDDDDDDIFGMFAHNAKWHIRTFTHSIIVGITVQSGCQLKWPKLFDSTNSSLACVAFGSMHLQSQAIEAQSCKAFWYFVLLSLWKASGMGWQEYCVFCMPVRKRMCLYCIMYMDEWMNWWAKKGQNFGQTKQPKLSTMYNGKLPSNVHEKHTHIDFVWAQTRIPSITLNSVICVYVCVMHNVY